MFATVHTASAILIATKISSPWWIIFLSLLSHYLLDFIPHGDQILEDGLYETGNRRKKAIIRLTVVTIIDLIITLTLTLIFIKWLSGVFWGNIALAVFAVLAPDFLMGFGKIIYILKLEYKKNIFIKFILLTYDFHYKIHTFLTNKYQVFHKIKLWQGILLQLFIIIIFLLII